MPKLRGGDHVPSEETALVPVAAISLEEWSDANPNGRPRGSRSKYAEDFLEDMHDAWQSLWPTRLDDCSAD